MVKIAKVKTKGTQKVKVTKAVTAPKLVPVSFLEGTPALGTRGKRKKEEEDEKLMVHE